MTIPFGDSAVPRYRQIADLMRQRIARGQWSKGQKLPSLEELVGQFGVARVTVRQAMELLARDGLVSAQRGRGTFVTDAPPRSQWLNVQTSLDELVKVYKDTRPEIVNIDESTARAPLAPEDGTPAEHYVFMRRVHSREGRPYCVINIYVDQQLFRRHPKRFRNETVIPLLVGMGVVAHARQVLTVNTADMEVAPLLRVPVNSPVAEVRRVFTDADHRVIYLGEVTYRGDFIHVEMDLKP
jgi:GntR family transcriptional regulator